MAPDAHRRRRARLLALVAGALFVASPAPCAAQEGLDMEELLRRVDLDGGDINLDDLLRQAAGAESDHSEDGGNAASGAPQGSADGAAGDREARPTAGTGAAAGGGIDDDMPPARTPNAPQRDTPMRPGAGGGGAATARGGGMEATRSPGSEPTDESADDALRFAEWKAAAGAPDPFAGMGVGSDSGGDYDDDEDDNGDGDVDDDSDEDDEGSFSDQDWKGALAFRLDRSTLTFARRWGNVVNGVLLALTGPLALIFSASQLAIGKAVLALHVTSLGLLLSIHELRLPPYATWLRSNARFLRSNVGKAVFLLFAGNMLWVFGKVGVAPAVLTVANSAFNARFESIVSRFDG